MENRPSGIVKTLRFAVLDGICILILVISSNFYISVVLLPAILVLSLVVFFRIRNELRDSLTEE